MTAAQQILDGMWEHLKGKEQARELLEVSAATLVELAHYDNLTEWEEQLREEMERRGMNPDLFLETSEQRPAARSTR